MSRHDCGCDDDFFTRSRKRSARSSSDTSPREVHDKSVIMRHYRSMDYRRANPNATIISDQVSRSCGDQVRIFIGLDSTGVISSASYQGEGCSVSIASCSIMCGAIVGRSLDEAACLARDVVGMLDSKDGVDARIFLDFLIDRSGGLNEQGHAENNAMDDVLALWGIRAIGARVPCALLSWNILPKLSENPVKRAQES